MIVALIDNGSLEPAAHRNLRTLAATLSARTGVTVHAVSWKHSDKISPASLSDDTSRAAGTPPPRAWTLVPFVRSHLTRGERDFLFVPFFISAQGAIGSALRLDLERLSREAGPFSFAFADGLAARGALPQIVADRIRETTGSLGVPRPPVVVVDHGGPSPASAALRNALAAQLRTELGAEIGVLAAASMEGAEHPHNRPLLADLLASPGFDRGDVVIAPLFLAPGRHAGPRGDIAQIVRAAEDRAPATLRGHVSALVGTHPRVADILTLALRDALSTFPEHAAA